MQLKTNILIQEGNDSHIFFSKEILAKNNLEKFIDNLI
jgi:hypothetical protein